jgi:hypothetical protein
MVGEIKTFHAETIRNEGAGIWYLISILFEAGTIGRIEILPTSGMVEESYEFFGESFRARVTAGAGPQRTLELWRDNELVRGATADDSEPEDLRNGSYQEVEAFIGALSKGRWPYPQIQEILPSARICFAIAESVTEVERAGKHRH